MKFGDNLINARNQIQWAALLAVAVVLPTISLLWFMSQVVANERLVVRQKLAALYQDKLADATAKTESLFAGRLRALDRMSATANPYSLLRRLMAENNGVGVVAWDQHGTILYPQSATISANDFPVGSPLAEASQEEFARLQYAEAARLYGPICFDSDPRAALTARLGKSRCFSKLGRWNDAIDECGRAAFTILPQGADTSAWLALEHSRLMLLSLLSSSSNSPAHDALRQRTLDSLRGDLFGVGSDRAALMAGDHLFIARKVLEMMRSSKSADPRVMEELERFISAEELSFAAAETLQPLAGQSEGFFQTELNGKKFFALRHGNVSSTLLVLFSTNGMTSALAGYRDVFAGTEATYRIISATGAFVDGVAGPKGNIFSTAALPAGFPGWKVELYFEGSDVFEKAASRQITVYIWTGLLVILLILIAGAIAVRAVGRQIRLNRMKNDFIATVSHELKTPLASMRVLVDTLLEGRVRDEAQVREYLRLTARENERLSRMIDNFLTFSRMERNKVAFTFAQAHPAAIVSDAVESVKTKFAAHDCHLAVEIAEDLPEIQADHDAMVTVLVNLLDNACKYTADNKQIGLKVFTKKDGVCFEVCDNGIGLARRHQRKIFERFYQVDNSLSRKTGGCGLGLSIVKFIIDAHKGKITIESKPGVGSSFAVCLPSGRQNS